MELLGAGLKTIFEPIFTPPPSSPPPISASPPFDPLAKIKNSAHGRQVDGQLAAHGTDFHGKMANFEANMANLGGANSDYVNGFGMRGVISVDEALRRRQNSRFNYSFSLII